MPEEIEELSSAIEQAFVAEDLIGYWEIILNKYRAMGFTDQIDDERRIQEFTYITDQLRKYIGTKKARVLKHKGNWTDMLDEVNDIVSKLEDRATDRKELVYIALRNDWITGLWQLVSMIVDYSIEEDVD